MKVMSELLAEAREKHYDNSIMVKKLRAMLQSTEDNARMLKKQSTFLSQLAAKTVPKGLHCFSMRLTVEYHMLSAEEQKFEHEERLGDPNLYHYALFSDNILAAAVVVNSTVSNAKVG
jgi:alpha-1,4-galacturonosyltransferase